MAGRPVAKLLYYRFLLRGHVWRMLFARPSEMMDNGIHRDGETNFATREILLDVTQPIRRIGPTIMHEHSHAAKGDGDGEGFILAAERGLWDISQSMGWTLPPYPEGFREMRKRYLKRSRFR